jgi:TRAP-type mannitol/chloroaromatic compound transport system substrate-binding protein
MFRLKDRLTQKTRHVGASNSTKMSFNPASKGFQLQTFWRQQQEFRATKIMNQTKMLERYQRQFQKAVEVKNEQLYRHHP